jgi:hypothetical protein
MWKGDPYEYLNFGVLIPSSVYKETVLLSTNDATTDDFLQQLKTVLYVTVSGLQVNFDVPKLVCVGDENDANTNDSVYEDFGQGVAWNDYRLEDNTGIEALVWN